MNKKKIAVISIIIVMVLALVVAGIIFHVTREEDAKEKPPVQLPVSQEDTQQDDQDADTEDADTEAELQDTDAEVVPESEEVVPEKTFDDANAISVWTTSNLNLREKADKSSAVITVIPSGTEIKKCEEENGWAFVKHSENIGYVSAQYIAETKPEEKTETANTSTNSKVEAIPGQHRDPNSAVVVIDPGHQLRGDSTKEPNGPGSSTMKARVTSGTTGVATGVAEYIMNLEVSLKLKTELENRGYTVYMTRSTHDINISNKERAEYATSVGADIAVRIHGNGSSSSSVHGAEAYAPSANNPYVSYLSKASISLSKCILDAYCQATGFKNRGVFASDTMTGINWSTVPVTIIELGYMSNAEEDRKMQDDTIQNNMVQGIANGIDAYFGF